MNNEQSRIETAAVRSGQEPAADLWVRFCVAALNADCTADEAAQRADQSLAEYGRRFGHSLSSDRSE